MRTHIMMMAFVAVCITAQAQPYRIQNMENEREEKERFFSVQRPLISPQKSTRNENIFPLEGLYYWGAYYPYDTAIGTLTYKYHENGRLREVFQDVFPHIWGFEKIKQEYNHTFTIEGKDMVDTTTYYRSSNGVYQPYDKYIHNHHYYDKFETDSFYYERTKQQWNAVNKKWKNVYKEYIGYADTVMWNMTRFIYYVESTSGWKPKEIWLDSLIYDEQGFVTARIITVKQFGGDSIEWYHDYYLNEDGSIYAIDKYYRRYHSNDEWKLYAKDTDITYALWLGYGGYDVVTYAGKDNIPINGKRNKITSRTRWVKVGDEWKFDYTLKKYWDLDDYGSNTDTTFLSLDNGETLYLSNSQTFRYDEYGNATELSYLFWEMPDAQGNQLINDGKRHKRQYLYNEYGLSKFEVWVEVYDTARCQWDSLTQYKEEVTKWGDPFTGIPELPQGEKQSLVIAPNPVSGVVTISATAEIEQLDIFDITGRLVFTSPNPSKGGGLSQKQTTFDAAILPQGIYIVQARLRDGGAQRGKLVVR